VETTWNRFRFVNKLSPKTAEPRARASPARPSGSMMGEKMSQLNAGLQEFEQQLKSYSSPLSASKSRSLPSVAVKRSSRSSRLTPFGPPALNTLGVRRGFPQSARGIDRRNRRKQDTRLKGQSPTNYTGPGSFFSHY